MALKEILCPECGSQTYRAGVNRGNQRYKCRNKECYIAFQEEYERKGCDAGTEDKVLKLMTENCSMRGISRILGVSLPYVIKVVKKSRTKSSTSTIS